MREAPITHLFVKALNEAGVRFPSSSEEIVKKLGDTKLRLSEQTVINAAELAESVYPDYFENGAAFMCAYHSALYSSAKELFLKSRAD